MSDRVTLQQPILVAPIHGPQRAKLVSWGCGMLVTVVSLAAVVHNVWPASLRSVGYQLPAAYGVSLAMFASSRFYWFTRFGSDLRALELHDLSRHLSRLVYLSLYVLIAGNEVCAFLDGQALAASAAKLQSYLVAGILVLVWIRLLAFWRTGLLKPLTRWGSARGNSPRARPTFVAPRHWLRGTIAHRDQRDSSPPK